jgi:DNA-binding transcriptional regulator YiaG
VQPVTEDYAVKVRHDGKDYDVCVSNAVVPACSKCGRKVVTGTLGEQLDAALRQKLGLLSPEEIKAGIEGLGLSQKDVAARLGLAQETLSRWITGAMIQTRANDRFLRLFLQLPEAREFLRRTAASA